MHLTCNKFMKNLSLEYIKDIYDELHVFLIKRI